MKVDFEEKTYESYFNNELDSKSSVYFPPGQVLEGLLGFDAASNSKNRQLWRTLGYPFWLFPHFSGVNLLDIARELEQELERFINKIPNIKTNILLQYKRPEYITTANGKEWSCNPPSKPQGLFVENSINMNSRSFLCVNQNSLRARLWQFSNKMRLEYQSLSYAVSMVLAQLRSTSGAQNMAAWTLRS